MRPSAVTRILGRYRLAALVIGLVAVLTGLGEGPPSGCESHGSQTRADREQSRLGSEPESPRSPGRPGLGSVRWARRLWSRRSPAAVRIV
jgi:hypothetical protein